MRLRAREIPCLIVGDLGIYLKVGVIVELMDEKEMFLMNAVSKERGSSDEFGYVLCKLRTQLWVVGEGELVMCEAVGLMS